MNESKDNNGTRKLGVFFISGFKKMISPNVEGSYITKHIKERSIDICSIFIDVIYIIWSSIMIIIYYIISMFKIAKNAPQAINKAAKNNFRLGIEALKKNNLIDARIRFLLANMFYSKSPTIKYYIAYVYYLQDNISKSLQYLKQAISLNSQHEKTIFLLKKIEDKIKNDR